MDETVGVVLICLVVGLIVWLICRELICWYWKINKAIGLLESIDQRLKTLADASRE